jgi:hypothetical protein
VKEVSMPDPDYKAMCKESIDYDYTWNDIPEDVWDLILRAQPEPPVALAESVSVLDAKAWAYIGRQAILGDPDAQSLVDLLSAPSTHPALITP